MAIMGTNSPGMDEVRHHWGWVLTLGIALLILGLLAVSMPVVATFATVIFLGCLLLIDGAFEMANAFRHGHYGDFWLALEGARALMERAAVAFDDAWRRGTSLTENERGRVAIAVAAAKVATARASLDVTSRMFEVTGARATTAALRLDRYWRNLRVHTLHDPVDYKVRELGDWALNERIPVPTFYS